MPLFEDDDLCRKIRWHGYACYIANTWVKHLDHKSFEANNIDHDRMLEESRAKYNKKWPGIAAICITLNEEAGILGWFEQFTQAGCKKGILDSGSEDKTVELCSGRKDIKVLGKEFVNFSDQRNAAMRMLANGSSEWIFMFDPDERLNPDTLKHAYHLMQQDEFDIFLSPLVSKNYDGTLTEWVPKPFLFRNKPEIKWVYPAHEKLVGSMRQAIVTNALLTHDLALHDPQRRKEAVTEYHKLLGQHDNEGDYEGFPILSYNHRDDLRIVKIKLGDRGYTKCV